MRRLTTSGAAVLVAMLLGGGCATGSEDAAVSAALAFRDAVAAEDGKRACGLLAERARLELEQSSGRTCDRAVLDEVPAGPGAGEGVAVFGTMARVGSGDGAVFLSRYDVGWRVVAAGCSATTTDRPYDCAVTVG